MSSNLRGEVEDTFGTYMNEFLLTILMDFKAVEIHSKCFMPYNIYIKGRESIQIVF